MEIMKLPQVERMTSLSKPTILPAHPTRPIPPGIAVVQSIRRLEEGRD